MPRIILKLTCLMNLEKKRKSSISNSSSSIVTILSTISCVGNLQHIVIKHDDCSNEVRKNKARTWPKLLFSPEL